MTLRILNVAYPFAPAGPDAVGGAEQVLTRIDRALVSAGHQSFVLGCEGTRGHGRVITAFPLPDTLSDGWRQHAQNLYRSAIEETIDNYEIQLIHFHGGDFPTYLPRRDIPILATVHLPPAWYPPEILAAPPENLWLHCVSRAQHAACPASAKLLPPIENGVEIPETRGRNRSNFALSMGRICPEKGFHLAMDAARRAGTKFMLGGEVFPYEAHLRYFEEEIRPRENRDARFIGPLCVRRKIRYLQKARCLLVPSLVPETSSLVAMEALSCGTPVIAFGNGALPTIVEHGRTGFIVSNVDEMAEAIRHAERILPEDCRAAARERFSSEVMTRRYLERYEELVASSPNASDRSEAKFAQA